ncbi:hypothetical protein [Paractinoplanes ferrugineus]|nr:hypothetical protein [Actinoplanes ferrugineus]
MSLTTDDEDDSWHVTLDPAGAEGAPVEGLWDCETDVRLFAAEHAPLTDRTRERLRRPG